MKMSSCLNFKRTLSFGMFHLTLCCCIKIPVRKEFNLRKANMNGVNHNDMLKLVLMVKL